MPSTINIHWFRRDLRLEDNAALFNALRSGRPVIPLFIFDSNILAKLERDDARVRFIHDRLQLIHGELQKIGSGLLVLHGEPESVWTKLISNYSIETVFTNRDYEPYAKERDCSIAGLLERKGIAFETFKDQVIFEPGEVLKDNGEPYTVYTPYSKKCFSYFKEEMLSPFKSEDFKDGFHRFNQSPTMPTLEQIGFKRSEIEVRPFKNDAGNISGYDQARDFPALKGTSDLSPHLRFGTVSTRRVMADTHKVNHTFAKELFWREFFMQILHFFPHVVQSSFRAKYDRIVWRNDEEEFAKWCAGMTGYPMVDAGMRELNQSGYMHNRVRMVVASFLCKHLLIDWRWGEAYFASKLLDFDLASNNGNWQWAAGTGCDAAPYFRVFNPTSQMEKFDKQKKYIKEWLPEWGTEEYPKPMVDHKMARERALAAYKEGLALT